MLIFEPPYGVQFSFDIQTRRMVFSGWVLPFLYGLLGASVYLMRSLLNVAVGNLQFFPVILRLALGGIAGLVIGWFSIPAPGSTVPAISSIPFGVAFLAGFSIEALFALLERLAQTVSAAPLPRRNVGPRHTAPGATIR